MDDFLTLFARHGYGLLALIVFVEAIGMPVPAALALLAAGAACALHVMHPLPAILIATSAMITGDTLMFWVGRFSGWGLLGFLCRVSMNPETCILRSAESFYKRGKATLLFAKFVPGLNTMAPPLAGSMRMSPWKFLRYDLGGALLYILAYAGAGFLFSGFMRTIKHGLAVASHTFEILLILAAIAYLAYRIWAYKQQRVYRIVPRVQVDELAVLFNSEEEKDRIIIADVRSHGYYDAGANRIHGSIRIEPNNLDAEMDKLPRDKHIYLYCT
jgi:membrane protein DedA with SNARE-associated domain